MISVINKEKIIILGAGSPHMGNTPSALIETSSGKMINLNGSRSLAEFIANDSKSQKAFIKSMFEYMIKQPIQAYGQKTMEYLFNGFRESGYNCRELLVDIMCISSIQGIEKGDL